MTKRIMERGKSSGRVDDNEEAIRKRLVTYRESTMPIIKEFEARGKMRQVNSDQTIGEKNEHVQVEKKTRACWKREQSGRLRRRSTQVLLCQAMPHACGSCLKMQGIVEGVDMLFTSYRRQRFRGENSRVRGKTLPKDHEKIEQVAHADVEAHGSMENDEDIGIAALNSCV